MNELDASAQRKRHDPWYTGPDPFVNMEVRVTKGKYKLYDGAIRGSRIDQKGEWYVSVAWSPSSASAGRQADDVKLEDVLEFQYVISFMLSKYMTLYPTIQHWPAPIASALDSQSQGTGQSPFSR